MNKQIAIGSIEGGYNELPPYHPDNFFPELLIKEISSAKNETYELVRSLFCDLELDIKNFGKETWNPLGYIIIPGQTVLIKPNFVLHTNFSKDDLYAIVTHPSLIRVFIDYIFIALKGQGRIIIADAPMRNCKWNILMAQLHLDSIQHLYRENFNFNIEVYDLRDFELIDEYEHGLSTNRKKLPGDPSGNVIINLGEKSKFYGLSNQNFMGADYDREETRKHHEGNIHEYSLSKTILESDVLIFMPKMKVHKKVGVTLNLKGLVGINTNKNFLIHYKVGTKDEGGDELPYYEKISDKLLVRAQRRLYDVLLAKQNKVFDFLYKTARFLYKNAISYFLKFSKLTEVAIDGNWHGNDSSWRMVSDLHEIITSYDSEGNFSTSVKRKIFCVVDGIVGGENQGPLAASKKESKTIIIGEDPVLVDIVTTTLMGFDFNKIKYLSPENLSKTKMENLYNCQIVEKKKYRFQQILS